MKKMSDDRERWSDYQKLVLSELERLDRGLSDLDEKFDVVRSNELAEIQAELKLLKFKSTLWGGMAGGIPAILMVLIKIFGE